MANITISTSGNIFNIDFGTYVSALSMKKATFAKAKVQFVLMPADEFVKVVVQDSIDFAVSYDGLGNTLQIDTINGVAPTSNSDLYDKLAALL